tara:strand:- start:164 stop:805 length:642 start_codon:yes stop_codon:yes gene_type:complete
MFINEHFKTPIWIEEKKEFLISLTKSTNNIIKKCKSRKDSKEWIKKHGDFWATYHSESLINNNDFIDFRNYVGNQSYRFLEYQGFDLEQYRLHFNELWVQEFAKKGGGNHSAHIHWNQHVSGFYFLKCSDKTSYPIFHDPRTGARTTKLHLKKTNKDTVHPGSELIHYKPKPGTLIIFPGYLEHEFAVDQGIDPFRFIHFNLQAVPKQYFNEL